MPCPRDVQHLHMFGRVACFTAVHYGNPAPACFELFLQSAKAATASTQSHLCRRCYPTLRFIRLCLTVHDNVSYVRCGHHSACGRCRDVANRLDAEHG